MGIDAFSNRHNGNERTAKRLPLSQIEQARREVEHITDGLNLSIDEGIREAVAVLRALKVDTIQSCEGHLDRGSPSPYVDVQALGEPAHRFQVEAEQLQAIADKHDITPGEIAAWPHEEDRSRRAESAHQEWLEWAADPSREETPEYEAWERANQRTQATIEKLIEEFYSTRPRPAEGYVLLEHDRLRTASALYDRYFAAALKRDASPLSDTDREQLRSQLPSAQAEMQEFIAFLKRTLFENAEA